MFQTIRHGKGYIHVTNYTGNADACGDVRCEEFRVQLANGDMRGPFKSIKAAKAAITKGK